VLIFGFGLSLIFEAMNGFVMISKVFWVKNGLQKRFLDQKSIGFDFPTTIMVKI
jgi:hypothetical protein